MKNLFILLSATFFLNIQAQFVEKPFQQLVHQERAAALKRMLQQPLANTGNYDVVFHRLELEPSLTSRHLQGKVTTYFKPVQNLNQMEFDFTNQMNVTNITWHNQNLTYSQTANRLIIDFPQNLPVGTLDSLQISYSGNVPNTGLDSYTVTTHGADNVPVVWTLSEPYGAKDWWPCKQDLTDKADSIEVVLSYEKRDANFNELYGVSNGLKISDEVMSNSEGLPDIKTTTWKHRYPIAAYLVAFAITNYTKFSETAGITQNFPIDNYVYPENLADAQNNSINFLPVMNYFENTFGPYPFNNEKYGQIQFGWGGGMEHQTATFVVNYSRPLIAHELAHQWFGDAVTCGSWHDIWLNEGFATYSEALTREGLYGQIYIDNWKESANDYIITEPGGSVYVQDTTDIGRIFDYRLSYEKGAMVLNMLRLKTGDTHFFQGIRNYVNHKKFQFAKTPGFKAEMEAESGQDLQEFFNDWIYGEGFPTYQINVTRIGSGLYEVVVNQTTSHPSVSFFEMPLPFKFTDNNGHVYETLLDHTTNGQLFTVNTGFEITDVSFDPHHDIVKGNTTLNTSLNVGMEYLPVFNIMPNPATNFVSIQEPDTQKIEWVNILSLDGKMIKHFQRNFEHLKVEDLAPAVYLMEIKTPKGRTIQKFIKK